MNLFPRSQSTEEKDNEQPAIDNHPARLNVAGDAQEEQTVHQRYPLNLREDEIRILHIHLGDWGDPLVCDFRIVSLKEKPSYCALSYVWGKDAATFEVEVNQTIMKIQPNLHSALRRIRAHRKEEYLTLWADALCIDQSSTKERNHQVGIMGEIYSKCKEVLVWMGEMESAWVFWPAAQLERNAGRCYDFTYNISPQGHFKYLDGEQTTPMTIEIFPWDRKIDGWDQSKESEVFFHMAHFLHTLAWPGLFRNESFSSWGARWTGVQKEHFYKTLFNLQNNAWFTRLWVVQELVLAPHAQILLGPVVLPLETILHAKDQYDTLVERGVWQCTPKRDLSRKLLEDGIARFVEMGKLRGQIRSIGKEMSLVQIRLELLHRSASVDVDQIYALLGLSNTAEPTIKPDYGVSKHDLYTEVSRQHIIAKSSLLPLHLAGVPNLLPDLPSWVIDFSMWSTEMHHKFGFQTWNQLHKFYDGYQGRQYHHQVNFEGNILKLCAYFIDTVAEVGSRIDPHRMSQSAIKPWCPDLVRSRQPDDYYIPHYRSQMSDTTYKEAWIRTLCMDSYWPAAPIRKSNPRRLTDAQAGGLLRCSSRTHFKHLNPWAENADKSVYSDPAASSMETLRGSSAVEPAGDVEASFNYTIENVTAHKKMFVTKGGYIGMANSHIDAQDKIAIIAHKSARMLYILQDTGYPPDGITYTVKGSCYLHGWMDGGPKDLMYYEQKKDICIV